LAGTVLGVEGSCRADSDFAPENPFDGVSNALEIEVERIALRPRQLDEKTSLAFGAVLVAHPTKNGSSNDPCELRPGGAL